MTCLVNYICPADGKELVQDAHSLRCADGHEYLVVNGIPRFVPNKNYASAFGEQWRRYRLTQLDSHTGKPLSENRARRCMGEEVWRDLPGAKVLEVGCGAGRFTEVLLREGAGVVSVDLSDAVDANQENCPQNQSHMIAQADVYNLPFEPESFDVVFCLGVIQHTPDPDKTIRQLYKYVKPGGILVIDHYTLTLSAITRTAPVFRQILKRLPPAKGLKVTETLVRTLLPFHKLLRSHRLAQAVFSRISPITSFYHAFPWADEKLLEEWAFLDTHDALTDYYKHYKSARNIKKLLRSLGAENIHTEKVATVVEARGRRPGNVSE